MLFIASSRTIFFMALRDDGVANDEEATSAPNSIITNGIMYVTFFDVIFVSPLKS